MFRDLEEAVELERTERSAHLAQKEQDSVVITKLRKEKDLC